MDSLQDRVARVEALGVLSGFRRELYGCLSRRADALFELADAVLTVGGRVDSLVGLCLAGGFRRGHGALYDALASGGMDTRAVRGLLARSWRPAGTGPVRVAVDVSPWPRPHAATSPARCYCRSPCRCSPARKAVPGWPYSFAAGLEPGAHSWTALLDAVRLDPDTDATTATVAQVGRVTTALAQAGHLAGRPAPLFVFDAGYDLTRISHLLAARATPVQVLAGSNPTASTAPTRSNAPATWADAPAATARCSNSPTPPPGPPPTRPSPPPAAATAP